MEDPLLMWIVLLCWKRKPFEATISNKTAETFCSNVVSSENKTIQKPSPPFKAGAFVIFYIQVAQTAAQHWVEGMGKGKLYFSLFKLAKCQRGPCIHFVKQIQMVSTKNIYITFPLMEHISINSFENLLLNLQRSSKETYRLRLGKLQ